MDLITCNNGHFYDREKFSSCPHCQNFEADGINPTQAPNEMHIDKTMHVVPDNLDSPVMAGKVVIPGNDGISSDVQSQIKTEASKDKGKGAPPVSSKEDSTAGDKTIRYFDAIEAEPVTGWLVCIEGKKNFGKDFKLKVGGNFIGRASEMDICLAGDSSISRIKHAIVIYEPKNNIFIMQPGDSRELSYLNDNVVLSPVEIKANDIIQVGDTKLMFIPCCSDKFKWDDVIPDEEA